ncbi:probable LRR receptor-like serine/threonine-protein kinase At1g63430 [Fagus crenata]
MQVKLSSFKGTASKAKIPTTFNHAMWQDLEVACEDFSHIIGSSPDSWVYKDGEGCQFSWTRRMEIIIGVSRKLKYLHTELIEPPFTISELNSSAISLTEDFSPKLVDFESWKTILARSEKNSGAIGNQGDYCVLSNSLEACHLDVQGTVFMCVLSAEYLDLPEVMSYVLDPELKHFRFEDLKVVCEVVNLCIHQDSSKQLSMKELCNHSKIDTSISVDFKASSLAWAELSLSS